MDIGMLSVLCLIIGISLVPFGHCLIDEYHFIDQSLSWPEACDFCRLHYTDLATVESDKDLDRIIIPNGISAWIGLWDDPRMWKQVMGDAPNSWKWSAAGKTNPGGYQSWIWYEPNKYGGKEACVFAGRDKFWKDYFCGNKLTFMCFTVEFGAKEFIFVNITKSWTEAMDYCRQHYLDLAMIESVEENQVFTEILVNSSSDAWIGLFRSPWVWSDHSNSSFRHWAGGGLNNVDFGEDCIAQTSGKVWVDLPCSNKIPFVCHKVLKRSSTTNVQFTFQSNTDLTDANVNNQLLNQLKETLESVYSGVDFVLNWNTTPTKQEKRRQ